MSETRKSPVKSKWLSAGILNTAEHASTRILDAVATLYVLWSIPTEQFSQLAIAQAWVAPTLLFFIAPETILYRDFAKWNAEGRGVLLTRVRALRRFAWGKGIAAVLLAAAIAGFSFDDGFFALIWAFSLPLAPQIAGPDRELLRIDLKLKELNFVTVFQRGLYLLLLLGSVYFYGASMAALAFSAAIPALLSAGVSRFLIEGVFRGTAAVRLPEDSFVNIITRSLTGFSIWNHIAGIVVGWMQTMDLFFLGIFKFSALDVGLYSTVLKLANFSLAGPFAFSNLYAVHLGRSHAAAGADGKRAEWSKMFRLSGTLLAFAACQAAIFRIASPWLLSLLSRGRWSEGDITRMVAWLDWLLPACAVFGSLLLWTVWLSVRTPIRALVLRAYIPWGIIALTTYAGLIHTFGPNGAAYANLIVVALLIPLLTFTTLRAKREFI